MKQEIINYLQFTRQSTKKILEAFPKDQGNFKPQADMMNVTDQIYHIARSEVWIGNGLTGKGWDFSTFHEPHSEKISDALIYLDQVRTNTLKLINDLSEDAIKGSLEDPTFLKGMEVYKLLFSIADHECHHRGQLVVYLRLLGHKPPNIWG